MSCCATSSPASWVGVRCAMAAASCAPHDGSNMLHLGGLNVIADITVLLQAWLDPVHLPSAEQLTCKATGAPMNFLLQASGWWSCVLRGGEGDVNALAGARRMRLVIIALRVLQVYAPPMADVGHDSAFHRTVFMFVTPQVCVCVCVCVCVRVRVRSVAIDTCH